MKTGHFFGFLMVSIFFSSCLSNKNVATEMDLTDNKVIILGVVEYDYSELENKRVKGLDIILDSKEEYSNIKLPDEGLRKDRQIKQKFIGLIGNYGIYRLAGKQDVSTDESDNLLALMKAYRNQKSSENKPLVEFRVEDGKIINIGKLTVKYHGGAIINGKIYYTYSFLTDNADTTAISVFKATNPSVFEKFSKDVVLFNGE